MTVPIEVIEGYLIKNSFIWIDYWKKLCNPMNKLFPRNIDFPTTQIDKNTMKWYILQGG